MVGFAAALGAVLLALPRKWWYGVAPLALAPLLIPRCGSLTAYPPRW